MDKKLLFYGGIFGPIVFLLNDIIGSIITQGYSPIINAVSELTQAGSENIYLLSSLFLVSAIMLIAFGIGIGLYKEKQWKSFRLYSLITVLIIVIFGGLTSVLMMNDIELLGLFERITIYSYQLWLFILAILFIKGQSTSKSKG